MTRIYYHIEPSGREYFQKLLDEYNRLNEAILNILYHETENEENEEQRLV